MRIDFSGPRCGSLAKTRIFFSNRLYIRKILKNASLFCVFISAIGAIERGKSHYFLRRKVRFLPNETEFSSERNENPLRRRSKRRKNRSKNTGVRGASRERSSWLMLTFRSVHANIGVNRCGLSCGQPSISRVFAKDVVSEKWLFQANCRP